MAYYRVCSNCGCNIDPGEICDCRAEKEKEVAPLTRKRPLAKVPIASLPVTRCEVKRSGGVQQWMKN